MKKSGAEPLELSQSELARIRRSAAATLRHLRGIGITHLPHPTAPLTFTSPATSAAPHDAAETTAPPPSTDERLAPPRPPETPPQAGAADAYGPALPIAQRSALLAEIATEVSSCTRCEELARMRRNTVPGEGNPAARVCFFGEGPGADEDRTGRPFVGRAGQLLTKIIEATTFAREDVFILNTVKCRPPGNRNPTPEEVDNCCGYFRRQFETIQPEYIVCLGLVAARALFPAADAVGRMRGRFHRYRGSRVVVTYHPSYLLRNPSAKKAVWVDMQMLMRDMGIPVKK